MSGGKKHAKASVAFSLPTGVAVWLLTGNALEAILASLGCVVGVVLSPDLDINHRTYSETVLPEPLQTAFYLWWLPYAWFIRHRSWVSHMPVVGTLIRVAYAFWWVPFVWCVDPLWWWVVVGLCVSDTLHWVMDI